MTRGRLLAAALAIAVAAFLPVAHVLAPPALACSCAGPQPLATYAREPQNAIFTGMAGPREARGVPVVVDRWFAGLGASPQVWIAGDFGNGASCGVGAAPAPGSRWLWVAWRAEPAGDLSISICQPTANLDAPEGQALLAEAVATFGGGSATAQPTTQPSPSPAADVAGVAGVGLAIAAGLIVLGGAVLLARRTPRRGA